MKKVIVLILALAICLCLASCAEKAPVKELTPEEAYENILAELAKKTDDEKGIISAQIKCGSGEAILAVADASMSFGGGQSAAAALYQYVDGEVKYIGNVASTGSAYPLSYTDEGIIFGGNHTSGLVTVSNGVGTEYVIREFNIDGKTPVLSVNELSNGKVTTISTEELTNDEALEKDFYGNAFADDSATIIYFK